MVTYIGVLPPTQVMNILQGIELHEKTGELLITQGEWRVRLYFLQGKIVHTDFLAESTIGERLVQAEILSQHDLQKALFAQKIKQNSLPASNTQKDISIVTTLTDLGLVSSKQLQDCATKDIITILQGILTWTAGEVSFDEGKISPADRLPIALYATSLISAISGFSSIRSSSEVSKPLERKPSSLFKLPKPDLKEEPGTTISPTSISDMPTNVQHVAKQPTLKSTASYVPNYSPTQKVATVQRPRNPILYWETFVIVAVLLIVALAHGINMFHYPYYESDEGTYMSQAWAVVHQGRLAYYTYWYDHAPAGWIQIALWAFITGGFHTFGPAIDSGRVLIFFMQIASTFMLYRIARSISNSITVAVIASLLFALSPYGLYFYRRVLLDNFAMFWMLLSILLLVSGHLSLKRVWLSAITLGISALSKELTVFLLPAMAYLVVIRADKSHRLFAAIGWVTLFIAFVSLYPLMAILNNELFPTGTLLGGTAPHVSLLGSLQYQASRGKDGGFFSLGSNFWTQTKVWIQGDPVLIVVGSFCALISVVLIKWYRLVGAMGLLTFSIWAFFARGGVIFNFYIVPLLPLLALNLGLLLGLFAKGVRIGWQKITRSRGIVGGLIEKFIIVACLCGIIAGCYGSTMKVGYHYADPALAYKNNPLILWKNVQSNAQNQATSWIKNNLPTESSMVIDESAWSDLYDSGYTSAQYYWKVERDPAIRDKILHDNWRNVDYIVTTPQMLIDIQTGGLLLVKAILDHSTPIKSFDTGGWTVVVRKVNK